MCSNYSVDVVIPTFKPNYKLRKLIEKLYEQTYSVNKIIIVNTEEKYFNTAEYLLFDKVEIHHIKSCEFNHGTTRDYGISFSDADIVVMMTQDAVPDNDRLIEYLVKPFSDENVLISYGRQLPDGNCRFIESYTREFNYPNRDIVKTKEDLDKLGIKTFFCSDTCAAYRRKQYIRLGGFQYTIFGEDTILAAKVIEAGKKVYYSAEAKVVHSHNYSYKKQLQRNFDVGVMHKDFDNIYGKVKSESEGKKLVLQTMEYLIDNHKWYLIPDLILASGFKYIGYKLGHKYRGMSENMIMKLTDNKQYWINKKNN